MAKYDATTEKCYTVVKAGSVVAVSSRFYRDFKTSSVTQDAQFVANDQTTSFNLFGFVQAFSDSDFVEPLGSEIQGETVTFTPLSSKFYEENERSLDLETQAALNFG